MTDPEAPLPALRASDAERERAADVLREAMASGRLTVQELDERMQLVLVARTRAELEGLVDDVLVPTRDDHPLSGGLPSPAVARVPVGEAGQETHRIRSILSSSQRRGRWRLAPVCSVLSVLGSSELDLSGVVLTEASVELTVRTVLGNAELTLPANLNVHITELGVLGNNEIDIGEEEPDPGGPTVHLRLVTVLGNAEVRRAPRAASQINAARSAGLGAGELDPPDPADI